MDNSFQAALDALAPQVLAVYLISGIIWGAALYYIVRKAVRDGATTALIDAGLVKAESALAPLLADEIDERHALADQERQRQERAASSEPESTSFFGRE